jgi:hypothetical protein
MGYMNPLLNLPAGRALLALPAEQREPLEALLRQLRAQADAEAEKAWSKRKGPMAAYWRAVATYARHTAHALSRRCGPTGPSASTQQAGPANQQQRSSRRRNVRDELC